MFSTMFNVHFTACKRNSILFTAKPGPIPGMRPPMGGAGHVVPPSTKGTSSMSVIMPIYTIGIVIFFTYTLMKVSLRNPTRSHDRNGSSCSFSSKSSRTLRGARCIRPSRQTGNSGGRFSNLKGVSWPRGTRGKERRASWVSFVFTVCVRCDEKCFVTAARPEGKRCK